MRIERVTPLADTPQRDGRYVIVASKEGIAKPPKLVSRPGGEPNPKVNVDVGSQTFTVLAEELDDSAGAELWPKLVGASPSIGEFQTRTRRQVPVLVLTARIDPYCGRPGG